MMRIFTAAALFFCLSAPGWCQNQHKPYPGVDQARVDAAIDKGVAYLLENPPVNPRQVPLILYTLHHSGVSRENPKFKSLLKDLLESRLTATYNVAIQAMLLQEMDATFYQWRIAQCGQFLVDNQLSNGQWGYGKETHIPDTPSFRPFTPQKGKTKVTPRSIKIRPQSQRTGTGDNSNSQYAVLGLRACILAKVHPPKRTFGLALRWWKKAQNSDGGWGYRDRNQGSYGSMTAGGIGCVVILDHYLRVNWKRDPRVIGAVRWMSKNISITENPVRGYAYFYYMYALERAGVLTRFNKFGKCDWYRQGANYLLKTQNPDGTWNENGRAAHGVTSNTCFAILFLRRGTPGLPGVATGR